MQVASDGVVYQPDPLGKRLSKGFMTEVLKGGHNRLPNIGLPSAGKAFCLPWRLLRWLARLCRCSV
jgi:hypothetical protein